MTRGMAGTNQLFKGDGKWSFSEVTSLTGLSNQNNRHSLAAAWHDYDHDGDPDLYIANDYGFNQLYRNDLKNGKRLFSEIAMMAGAQDRGAGMSVSWGDYNRDGLSDIYIGNMYSNAGNRITRMSGYLDKENASLKKYIVDSRKETPSLSKIRITNLMTMGLVYLWVDGPGAVSLLTSIMMVGKTSS